MSEDIEKLKEEQAAKVKQAFSSNDYLTDFVAKTLQNFSYRYIESATAGKGCLIEEKEGTLVIQTKETNMVEALKCKHNSKAHKGIMEMAKTHRLDKTSVLYEIGTEITRFGNEAGEVKAWAQVNWDWPRFHKKSDCISKKEVSFKFDEMIELRNNYARLLEEVCEVF